MLYEDRFGSVENSIILFMVSIFCTQSTMIGLLLSSKYKPKSQIILLYCLKRPHPLGLEVKKQKVESA